MEYKGQGEEGATKDCYMSWIKKLRRILSGMKLSRIVMSIR